MQTGEAVHRLHRMFHLVVAVGQQAVQQVLHHIRVVHPTNLLQILHFMPYGAKEQRHSAQQSRQERAILSLDGQMTKMLLLQNFNREQKYL